LDWDFEDFDFGEGAYHSDSETEKWGESHPTDQLIDELETIELRKAIT